MCSSSSHDISVFHYSSIYWIFRSQDYIILWDIVDNWLHQLLKYKSTELDHIELYLHMLFHVQFCMFVWLFYNEMWTFWLDILGIIGSISSLDTPRFSKLWEQSTCLYNHYTVQYAFPDIKCSVVFEVSCIRVKRYFLLKASISQLWLHFWACLWFSVAQTVFLILHIV
jgi:hypothetical protein